jgi:hypothetical protein
MNPSKKLVITNTKSKSKGRKLIKLSTISKIKKLKKTRSLVITAKKHKIKYKKGDLSLKNSNEQNKNQTFFTLFMFHGYTYPFLSLIMIISKGIITYYVLTIIKGKDLKVEERTGLSDELENKAESNNSNISNNNSNNNRDSRNKTINKVVEESKKSLKSKKDQKRVRSRKGGERKNIYGTDNSKLMFIQTHRDIISSSRSSDNSDHINYLKNSPLKVPGFNRRKNRRSFHALLLRNRNNPILKIGDVSIHFITKILSFICSLPYLFLKSIYSINWNETIRFISEFLSLFKVSSEGRVIVSGEVIFENIENNTKSKDHMKEPKNEQNYSNLNTNSSQKLVNRNNKSSKKIQLFNENNISMKEESSKIEDEIKETEQVNETNESISMPKVASKLSKDINSKLDKKGNLMSEDESLKRKIEIDSKENKEKLTSFPTQISSNEKVKMTPSSPKVDNKNGKNKNKHKNKNKNNGHNLTKEKLTMNSLNIANKIYEKPINITTTITTTTKK